MKRTIAFAGAVLSALGARAGLFSGPKPLFEDGKTEWAVVLAPDADITLQRAASEFTNAIYRVSGARMPVVAERPEKGSAVVITTFEDGAEDERLRARLVDGQTFEISGNRSRAALYATFRFLKEQLGVRWLWYGEDGAFFPPRKRWSFPEEFSYEHTPPIAYRGWHTCGAWRDIQGFREWMGHNCLNAQRHTIIDTSHDGDRWVSWGLIPMWSDHLAHVDRKLIKEHPEWFSLLGGKRTTEAICYTSEGAMGFVADRIADYLAKHPRTELVSFFPEDNLDYCQCETCKRQSVSDNWFSFFNKVVARLRPDHPKVKFSTLAYQGYLMPPKDPANLPKDCAFVEVCTHNRCNVHLFSNRDCKKNDADRRHYGEWAKTGVPMGSYTYEYNLFGAARFAPLFSFAEDAVKTGAKYAPRCFIPEIGLSPLKGPDTNAKVPVDRLTVQFYADLMWDPTLTFDRWLDDVTPYVFGAAADEMKAYLKILDRAWCTQPICTGYYKNPIDFVDTYFTPELEASAEAALTRAEATVAATDDARSKANVRRERILLNQWKDLRLAKEGKLKVANVLPCGERPGVLDDDAQPARELVTADGKAGGIAMRLGWVTKTLSHKHDGKPWPHALLVKLSGVRKGVRTAVAVTNEDGGKERVYREPSRVEGTVAYYEIPFEDVGEQFEPTSVWYVRAQAKAAKGPVARYPADGGRLQMRRSNLSATGRPFLFLNGWSDGEKGRAGTLMGGEGLGWDVTYCVDGVELSKADIERIPVLWFSNAGYAKKGREVKPAEWARVAKAVENGAIALFGAYCGVQTEKIFGKGYGAKVNASIGSIPVGNKVADYLAPGDWNKKPNNFSRHKPESLCYSQQPSDPTGWKALFTVKNAKGESVPYISCKPYGKGLVFLTGEGFGINRFKFAENILANRADLKQIPQPSTGELR